MLVGASAVGAALVDQPVDGVFFTGSIRPARIARAVGPRMVKLQLELGGKDPAYVCDDVDVPSAAASLADGAMYNTGQSCCSVERIYVHVAIHDAFVDAFVREVRGFMTSDPTDEAAYIGPLTRAPQLDPRPAGGRRPGKGQSCRWADSGSPDPATGSRRQDSRMSTTRWR